VLFLILRAAARQPGALYTRNPSESGYTTRRRPAPWMKVEYRLAVIARNRFATRQSDPKYVWPRIAASQVLRAMTMNRASGIPVSLKTL
jgi:hypothetical protein